MIELDNKNPDEIIYPRLCMASIGEVEIDPTIGGLENYPLAVGASRFSISMSSFRSNEDENHYHIMCGAINTAFPALPPKFSVFETRDINGPETKEFIDANFSCFKSFKRSILLFEPKAYKIAEFRQIMDDWKEDLNVLNKILKEENDHE